jgi:hypothetical protein
MRARLGLALAGCAAATACVAAPEAGSGIAGAGPRAGLLVQVVDAAGDGVAGAEVSAWRPGDWTGARRRIETARTDAEGRAVVRGAGAGWLLQATCGEGCSGVVSLPGEQRSLLLGVRAPCTVSGRVVDAAGAGVAGVTVLAEPSDRRVRLPAPLPACTDADGRFSFGLHAGGTYVVREERCVPVPVAADAAGGSTGIVLRRCERIRVGGVVFDGVGATVPAAAVCVRAGGSDVVTAADIDGSYHLEVLLDGPLHAAATADAHGLGLDRLVPLHRPADAADVVARLEIARVVSVSGEVVDALGQPLAGVRVRCLPARELPLRHPEPAVTDASGGFELPRLLAGEEYEVLAHGSRHTARQRVVAGSGTRLRLAAARVEDVRRSVRVRACDAATGTPLMHFEATAARGEGTGWTWGRVAEPGTDGTAEVVVRGRGALFVEVAAPDLGPVLVGPIADGVEHLAVSLPRAVPLRVLVHNDRGRPLPARVEARRPAGMPATAPIGGEVDAAGGCTLLLPPGTWTIAAVGAFDGATAERTVTLEGPAEVRLVLPAR